MQSIPIIAVPSQALSIQLDNLRYDIRIKSMDGIMAVDIVRSETPIVLGMRAVSGYFLIPYKYLESGNFIFITANEEYPDYTQFGITQFLIYFSQSELEQSRDQN